VGSNGGLENSFGGGTAIVLSLMRSSRNKVASTHRAIVHENSALRALPIRVFVRVMPRVVRWRAVAVGHIATAATAARRILTHTSHLLVGGLLGLIRPIGGAHVFGEGFLARDASVVAMVVVHH